MIKLKKTWGIIAVLFVLLSLTNVKAFSVEKDTFYIIPGNREEIHLYADVEEEIVSVSFNLTFSSYDASATFAPNKAFKDNAGNISHVVTLNEPTSGKIDLGVLTIKTKATARIGENAETVLINKGIAKTQSGKEIELDRVNILVYLGEQDEYTEDEEPVIDTTAELLDRIDSSIVNITLKKNVFEYTVTVPAGTVELDLKPITKSETVKVTTSSQKISELEDNTIIITLEDGKVTQKYKIKVNVKKAIQETEIDYSNENKEYHYKWKYLVIILICGLTIAGTLFIKISKNN